MSEKRSYEELEKRVLELEKAESDRKRTEKALKTRLVALTSPRDDSGIIAFEDLFNIDDIQCLQDEFANATGVASIITRTDGTPITQPSNFCRLCSHIIRQTNKGRANCYESDAAIGRLSPDGPTIQPCLSGGLWDAGAAISVGGKHLANWLIGQVRDNSQTEEKIREYAREIEANEEEAAEAFREVPAMSRDRFGQIAQMLFTLTRQLSTTAYQNVQQARFIAESKQAEKALRESEKRFRELTEMLPEAVFKTDRDLELTLANRRAFELFGYSPEELKRGLNAFALLAPEDRERAKANNALWFKGENPGVTEYKALRKDGSIFPMLFHLGAIINEGNIIGFRGIAVDITERKQAEQSLFESEARFKALHNASFGGIAIHDKGIILDCNQGLSKMTGYSITELVGSNGLLLIAKESRNAVMKNILSGYEKPYEAIGLRKNGEEYPIRLEARNIPYKGKNVRVAEFRDISEHKQAEEERQLLEERLQQADKMEALGTLAGGVAHDLNNILGAIIGYPELLLIELPADSPMRETLEKIYRAGQRAAAIVQDMLTIARQGVQTRDILDLNEAINAYMLSPEFQTLKDRHPKVQFVTELSNDLMSIMGSEIHLTKIIMNLVGNAAEAMPIGGNIGLMTRNRYVDTELNAYEKIPEGDYVLLSIKDEGVGIAQEDVLRIFEPFYSKKKMGRSGSGLGMTVVWSTVKDHGGYVDIESREGEGTRFDLYFPATREERKEARRQIVLEDYIGTESVLVVDDIPDQLTIAVRMLSKLGYNVAAASGGEEAIAYMQTHTVDLLVLDMVMPPGIDGLETYERIRELHPRQKAIIASGYTESERVNAMQAMGAGVYVRKPYTLEKIGIAVRRELDRK